MQKNEIIAFREALEKNADYDAYAKKRQPKGSVKKKGSTGGMIAGSVAGGAGSAAIGGRISKKYGYGLGGILGTFFGGKAGKKASESNKNYISKLAEKNLFPKSKKPILGQPKKGFVKSEDLNMKTSTRQKKWEKTRRQTYA
jgi:phage tail tape-measure protein